MKIVYVFLLVLILSGCKSEISDKKSNDNFTYSEADNDAVSESEVYSEAESELSSENIQYSETEYITTEEYKFTENKYEEAEREYEEAEREYEEAKKRAYEWLKEYEGEWVIDDLLCYYYAGDPEPDDPFYDYYINGIALPNDEYIGTNISIDAYNDIFSFGDRDIFKIFFAYEVSTECFIDSGFSSKSQFIAKKIIDDTWYKTNDNESDKSVKCIKVITGYPDNDPFIESYSLVIPGDGNLYINIHDAVGTYVLKRKEK